MTITMIIRIIMKIIMTLTMMVLVMMGASAALSPVRVRCTERAMVVLVHARALGSRAGVSVEEVRLGNGNSDRCGSAVSRGHELELRAELHECGSTLRLEGDSLVYENILFYSPMSNPYGIIRSVAARIPIQCRYQRTHFVSTNDQLKGAGLPGSAPLWFSLQLMTDDWASERFSSVFRLGDVINLRASMLSTEHTSLKLYVDSCVFTREPDTGNTPRYPLIHNHGCSADPRSGGPTVCFMPRMEDHVLQLQMDVNRLYRKKHDQIFITCLLKKADAAEEESSVNKACSYTENGWHSAGGNHVLCECCDTMCEDQRPSQVLKDDTADSDSSAVVTLGPVIILE